MSHAANKLKYRRLPNHQINDRPKNYLRWRRASWANHPRPRRARSVARDCPFRKFDPSNCSSWVPVESAGVLDGDPPNKFDLPPLNRSPPGTVGVCPRKSISADINRRRRAAKLHNYHVPLPDFRVDAYIPSIFDEERKKMFTDDDGSRPLHRPCECVTTHSGALHTIYLAQ